MTSNQNRFAAQWIEKSGTLQSIQGRLSEVESMLTVATAGFRTSLPVVSNLETVRAANKTQRDLQQERRPRDIKNQRQKRKRAREAAKRKLATVQTPLVEAHRPSKKRASEANRHQKNYELASKKYRIPKKMNPLMKSNLESKESNDKYDYVDI